jgi:hypothetical protein
MKQETLRDAAKNYQKHFGIRPNLFAQDDFIQGAKWQMERSYSEEEVKTAFLDGWQLRDGDLPFSKAMKKWFEQKKK